MSADVKANRKQQEVKDFEFLRLNPPLWIFQLE